MKKNQTIQKMQAIIAAQQRQIDADQETINRLIDEADRPPFRTWGEINAAAVLLDSRLNDPTRPVSTDDAALLGKLAGWLNHSLSVFDPRQTEAVTAEFTD